METKKENSSNCQICGTSESKYSCPRCHIPYCSVTCYQSNGHLECSEKFYEHCVLEELKNSHAQPEAKQRILDILKRNQESNAEENLDSDDEEATEDLATRMLNVDLDDEEAVWEKLTLEERQEFRKLVATGNIMKLLPAWEPWWKVKKQKTFIVDCDENTDWKSECPAVHSEIPELSKLTKVNPSPYVPFMLLNVLMSYAYTVRWFKGAHHILPVEAISTCISLSATLRDNTVFKTPIEACAAFQKDLSECEWLKDEQNIDEIREDLRDIINGSDENDPFFCLKAAICDLDLLCSETLVILKEAKNNHLRRFSGPLPGINLLQQISKKMNYYLSWTVSHGSSLLRLCDVT